MWSRTCRSPLGLSARSPRSGGALQRQQRVTAPAEGSPARIHYTHGDQFTPTVTNSHRAPTPGRHRASPRTCGEAVNLPNTLRIRILRTSYKIPLQYSMQFLDSHHHSQPHYSPGLIPLHVVLLPFPRPAVFKA